MNARIIILMMIGMLSAHSVIAAETATGNRIKLAKYDDTGLFQRKKPELKVQERYEYYDISGATIPELKSKMHKNGTKWNDGKVYAALTTWDIRYHYTTANSGGKYRIASANTDIDIVYHLPRFQAAATTQKQLAEQWSTYMNHLKEHEFGHKDLAVKAAAEINDMLASIGDCSSRRELDKEADRLVEAKLKQLKEIQIGYDADTHHGETQGAVLPD